MPRYIAMARRPKAYEDEWHDGSEGLTTITVHESDDGPQDTGLLDAHGTPLFRMSDRQPIGFYMRGGNQTG